MQHLVQFIRDGKAVTGKSNGRIYLKYSTLTCFVFIDKIAYILTPEERATFTCIKGAKNASKTSNKTV